MIKYQSWKDMPITVPGGTAVEYKTGDWRTYRPILNRERCIHCLQCWIFCPDTSIIVKEGRIAGFDYEHCKGCGICAKVCPPKVKAITMEKERETPQPTPSPQRGEGTDEGEAVW